MNGDSASVEVVGPEEDLPGLSEVEMAKIAEAAETSAKELTADEVVVMQRAMAPAGATAMPTVSQAEAIFDAQIAQIIGVVIRGLMVSTNVPPDVLWRSVMRVEARLIGDSLAGDLGPVFGARNAIKAALADTLKALPVKPAPPMLGQPMPPHRFRPT